MHKYTHKCVHKFPMHFVCSPVLGCHDVLLASCPGIPHVAPCATNVHVGGARLCFLALAHSMPLLCLLIYLGRSAFCGSSGGYRRRGSCRSLRVDMCTSECVRVWVQKNKFGFVLSCIKEPTSMHTQQIRNEINKNLRYIHVVGEGEKQKYVSPPTSIQYCSPPTKKRTV